MNIVIVLIGSVVLLYSLVQVGLEGWERFVDYERSQNQKELCSLLVEDLPEVRECNEMLEVRYEQDADAYFSDLHFCIERSRSYSQLKQCLEV